MTAVTPWHDPYIPQSEVLAAFDAYANWSREAIGEITITITAADGTETVIPISADPSGNPRSVDVSANIIVLTRGEHQVRVHRKITPNQLSTMIHDGGMPMRISYELGDIPMVCFDDSDHSSEPSSATKRSVCLPCSASIWEAECNRCGDVGWYEGSGTKARFHTCDGAPHHNFRR